MNDNNNNDDIHVPEICIINEVIVIVLCFAKFAKSNPPIKVYINNINYYALNAKFFFSEWVAQWHYRQLL